MENYYQEVFDEVLKCVSDEWKNIAVYCAIVDRMTDTKFYVDYGKGYIDCFNLGLDRKELLEIFYNIEKVLKEQRDALPKKKKWSVFTMIISETGKMSADFDYANIKNNSIEYGMNWEKRVLKI